MYVISYFYSLTHSLSLSIAVALEQNLTFAMEKFLLAKFPAKRTTEEYCCNYFSIETDDLDGNFFRLAPDGFISFHAKLRTELSLWMRARWSQFWFLLLRTPKSIGMLEVFFRIFYFQWKVKSSWAENCIWIIERVISICVVVRFIYILASSKLSPSHEMIAHLCFPTFAFGFLLSWDDKKQWKLLADYSCLSLSRRDDSTWNCLMVRRSARTKTFMTILTIDCCAFWGLQSSGLTIIVEGSVWLEVQLQCFEFLPVETK